MDEKPKFDDLIDAIWYLDSETGEMLLIDRLTGKELCRVDVGFYKNLKERNDND
jgi:hypothetical protein